MLLYFRNSDKIDNLYIFKVGSWYKGLYIWHLELGNPLTLPALDTDSVPVCGKSKKFQQQQQQPRAQSGSYR